MLVHTCMCVAEVANGSPLQCPFRERGVAFKHQPSMGVNAQRSCVHLVHVTRAAVPHRTGMNGMAYLEGGELTRTVTGNRKGATLTGMAS